jgi:hypothetical protein
MNIVLPSTLALTTVIGGVDVMAVSNTQVSLAVPLTLMPFTSTSIGGSSLTAGTCASTTVTITGLTTAMVIDTTPATYPGDAFYWRSYASAANTATVKVCAAAAGTPTASVFNLRVIQ